ncbi:hypothetical protein I79_001772 [Cricetulus griseus]|uniref:Uncharacterized protein n=1 Tax=Cricetulus griseus TaxID=10029 RepID=G3GVM8_CRIGR|nr:hypothetical protein I79_001772 [Cricetulus griseus]
MICSLSHQSVQHKLLEGTQFIVQKEKGSQGADGSEAGQRYPPLDTSSRDLQFPQPLSNVHRSQRRTLTFPQILGMKPRASHTLDKHFTISYIP